jgi:hypothetical protein
MTLQYALLVTEVRDPPNPTSGFDHTYRVTEICFEGEIERPSKSLVHNNLSFYVNFDWCIPSKHVLFLFYRDLDRHCR